MLQNKMVLHEAVKRIGGQFCKPGLAKPFEAPDSSEWRQVRDPVGGFGGVARRPSDHQGIHQIDRIWSTAGRQLARLTPAAAPDFFLCWAQGWLCRAAPAREVR